MDQFLPGDISVMILRFLAGSGCENAVFSMIEELPFMKFYVPTQPPGVSKSDYIKMLSRPSLTPGLSDLLNDYAKSKLLIGQMIQKQNPAGSPLRQCDSLVTQLKQLTDSLNRGERASSKPKPVAEVGTNTDLQPPPVRIPPAVVKAMTATETQTEECAIIEIGSNSSSGETSDVPLMFYNSLMSDISLPQKLASAINEHMTDPRPSNSKCDRLQKVCNQAETEIDKFMLDLLRDEDNNSCSLSGLFSKSDSPPPPLILNDNEGLSTLFRDADSLIGKDPPVTSANASTSFGNKVVEQPPIDGSVSVRGGSNSTATSQTAIFKNPHSPAGAKNSLPKTPAPAIPIKRIVPKPAPASAPRPNPVFELEVVPVEEVIVPPEGCPYSLSHLKPVPIRSDWEKLGRRPIGPRPRISSPKKNKPVISTEHKQIRTESPCQNKLPLSSNKRKGKLVTPVKMTPEKAKSQDFMLVYYDSPRPGSSTKAVQKSSGIEQNENGTNLKSPIYPEVPEEQSIPKITLVSVSPLKQKSNVDEWDKTRYQTPVEKLDQVVKPLLQPASQAAEVTPILDFLPSQNALTSGSETDWASPSLRRLIVSAQKIRATTTQVNLIRKSFSTPRKKKHVRSLQFITPPSFKGKDTPSPGSPSTLRTKNSHGVSISLPRKRKSANSMSDLQPKSKKRLQWCDDDINDVGYKSSAFPDRNFRSTSREAVSESMFYSAKAILEITRIPSPLAKRSSPLSAPFNGHALGNEPRSGNRRRDSLSLEENKRPSHSSVNALPKILEESFTGTQEGRSDTSDASGLTIVPAKTNATCSISATPISNAEDRPRPAVIANSNIKTVIQATPPPLPPKSIEKPPLPPLPISPAPITPNTPPAPVYIEEVEISTTPVERESSKNDSPESQINKKGRGRTKGQPNKSKTHSNTLVADLFGSASSLSEDEIEQPKKKPRKKKKTNTKVSHNTRKSITKPKVNTITPNCPSPNRRSQRLTNIQPSNVKQDQPSIIPIEKPQLEITPSPLPPKKNSKKTPTPVKIPNQTPSSSSEKPTRSRKSRRPDALAAQTVADIAVPLGRSSFSPKKNSKANKAITNSLRISPLKLILPKPSIPRTTAMANASTMTVPTITVSSAQNQNRPSTAEVVTVPSKSIFSPQATPVKESAVLLPFNILPGPIGFPDPTPIKVSIIEQREQETGPSALITPMKSFLPRAVSSPSIPPTPGNRITDLDLDSASNSNSLGMFKNMEDLYRADLINCTPSKFGPPPTPGRTIFDDERSQSQWGSISLHYVQQQHSKGGAPSVPAFNFEAPLDLSSPLKLLQADQPASKDANPVNEAPAVVPSHVSINRITPAVIVGKPLLADNSASTSTTTTTWTSTIDSQTGNIRFQIPKGAPKKISPANITVKKLTQPARPISNTSTTLTPAPIAIQKDPDPVPASSATEVSSGPGASPSSSATVTIENLHLTKGLPAELTISQGRAPKSFSPPRSTTNASGTQKGSHKPVAPLQDVLKPTTNNIANITKTTNQNNTGRISGEPDPVAPTGPKVMTFYVNGAKQFLSISRQRNILTIPGIDKTTLQPELTSRKTSPKKAIGAQGSHSSPAAVNRNSVKNTDLSHFLKNVDYNQVLKNVVHKT